MKKHSHILIFSYSQIWFAVLLWSLLVLRFGYRFGTGDQVELLPYTLYFHDSSLYLNDFFIQGLNASVPNERTIMAHLLLPFANHIEVFCFCFHFLSVIILILGLEKLARRFIRNDYFAWLAVFLTLIPLNDFTLGNVDLYSECFQASVLAVALIVWVIVFFLDRKYLFASTLLSLATFIQLLEGLDVMIVLSTILFIAAIRKEVSWKIFFSFISVYALTAGIYLVLILIQKSNSSSISNQELFKILFEFRHPHHFIIAAFPKVKMVVFFFLASVAVAFFSIRSRVLFQFALIGLIGIVLYAFAVDGLHNVFVGNFQFYKVTQWMKFMGVVACVGILEEVLNIQKEWLSNCKFQKVGLVMVSLLCWIIILNFNEYLPYKVPFQIFGLKQKDEMISICEKIKDTTAKESVFIQPFDNTEMKYYAQRSSYVEFKANVRNRAFVRQWYNRVKEVFGVDASMQVQGFALQKKADENYFHLSPVTILGLKEKGVTHLLTRKEFPPAMGSLILANNTYAVYQL